PCVFFSLYSFCYLLLQRLLGPRELSGPFHDALLDLAMEPLDVFLGSLQLGGFDHLPPPAAPCCRNLVEPSDIEDVRSATRGEWVGAQHHHALLGHDPIELFFVCAHIPPALLVSPDRGAGRAHAGRASGHSLCKFLLPALNDAMHIKSAFCAIPRIVWQHFYAALRQVAIMIRH